MKPTRIAYLLFILIVFFHLQAKSQDFDTAKNETIVKIENPYGKGRTKWLKRNGFDTDAYMWDCQEINLYVDQAIKKQRLANTLSYSGIGIVLLGLATNAVGRFGHEIGSKPNEPYRVFKAPYYLGGVLIVSSIPIHFSADKKLKVAIKTKASR